MLLENEVKKLLRDLIQSNAANIDLRGGSVTVRTFDNWNKLFLSTPVYFGANYIPPSVRDCLKRETPFTPCSIRTNLRVDEESYRIYLTFIGDVTSLEQERLSSILDDFSTLAEQWREYLDEHDQNDRVRVPIK